MAAWHRGLVGAFLILGGVCEAGDAWPQFRGPLGDGHSDARGVPATWSETSHVAWKTKLPGTGWSSPVILDGRIWMTTAEDKGLSLRALCVDQESGKILHNVEVFHLGETPVIHETNSYASPTPVLEPGRVYVNFGTHGTACLDAATAEVLWKNEELKLDHQVGPGSSPIVIGPHLILNCDGIDVRYVVALDKATGKIAWKTDRSGPPNASPDQRKAFSTPLLIEVAGQPQMVSPAADHVVAYDPATGAEQWSVKYSGFSNVPRPIFGHGLVYICTGYMAPQLWAIRPNGKGDVSATHVAWKVTKQVPAKPSPLLVGDELYLVNDAGIATCLDAETGKELWKDRLGGSYTASPVFVDGRIYIFNDQGKTLVFQPGREQKLLAENQLDAGFRASPAIVGKAMYLRTIEALYRIEE